MTILTLMEKQGEGQMNVPPAKVQQFLDNGWIIIRAADESLLEMPEPVSVETPVVENDTPVKRKKAKK